MVKQTKVALVARSSFGSEGEGVMRINLATPRILLEEALQRIENMIKACR